MQKWLDFLQGLKSISIRLNMAVMIKAYIYIGTLIP